MEYVRPVEVARRLILGPSQRVAEFLPHGSGVIAQDGVCGDVEPARFHGTAWDRADEAPDDLPEHERGLGCRRIYADPQAGDVNSLGDHVHGHDPRVAGVRERGQLLGGPGLVVQDDQCAAPGLLSEQ